jgi:hypothetical protein
MRMAEKCSEPMNLYFSILPRAGGTFVYDVGYKTIREVKTDFARS